MDMPWRMKLMSASELMSDCRLPELSTLYYNPFAGPFTNRRIHHTDRTIDAGVKTTGSISQINVLLQLFPESLVFDPLLR